MARTPYKMKSSPMLLTGDKKKKKIKDKHMQTTYGSTLDAVTADMTDEQLRDMALAQHQYKGEAKGGPWSISLNTLKSQRTSMKKAPVVEKTEKKKKEVVAPATLQESRDLVFKDDSRASDQPLFGKNVSKKRQMVIEEATKSGKMRDLAVAVEKKYGKELHEMDDATDRQMAGDAVIDEGGNILPMSSASGQYSGKSALPRKRGFTMKRNRK